MKQKQHTIIDLKQDMHVHSTYSDGKHGLTENIQQAQKQGLNTLCCVDHVRRNTKWVPQFIKEINSLRSKNSIQLYSGLETKVLNQHGLLDLPKDHQLADFLFVADHQFPLFNACYTPKQIKSLLDNKYLLKKTLVQSYMTAMIEVVNRYDNVVLAHLFSIFPKVGLKEQDVSIQDIRKLAKACKSKGASIEIDERWKCPNLRTLKVFYNEGVRIFNSSDSHIKKNIGQYQYNRNIANALDRYAA